MTSDKSVILKDIELGWGMGRVGGGIWEGGLKGGWGFRRWGLRILGRGGGTGGGVATPTPSPK